MRPSRAFFFTQALLANQLRKLFMGMRLVYASVFSGVSEHYSPYLLNNLEKCRKKLLNHSKLTAMLNT